MFPIRKAGLPIRIDTPRGQLWIRRLANAQNPAKAGVTALALGDPKHNWERPRRGGRTGHYSAIARSPKSALISAASGYASKPLTVADQTLAGISQVIFQASAKRDAEMGGAERKRRSAAVSAAGQTR